MAPFHAKYAEFFTQSTQSHFLGGGRCFDAVHPGFVLGGVRERKGFSSKSLGGAFYDLKNSNSDKEAF